MTVAPPVAGSSAPNAAPAPPTVLDDVNAMIADLEKSSAPPPAAVGQGAASEAPAATAQPAAKTGAAASVPPKPELKTGEQPPSATPPPKFYTDTELEAFDGEYNRRDFDWERVEPILRKRIGILESGTGKYRSRLETMVREENASKLPTPPAAEPQRGTPAEKVQASLEKFLNPETTFEGLRELLDTPQGKETLQRLGYNDPASREVVDGLVEENVMIRGIDAMAKKFPIYLTDKGFQNDVTAVIRADPRLLAKVKSRNVDDATDAFNTAAAAVALDRFGVITTDLSTRKTTLDAKEADLASRENALNAQIEATNRGEHPSPSVGGGGAVPGGEKSENSILDDVRELGPKFGLFTGAR